MKEDKVNRRADTEIKSIKSKVSAKFQHSKRWLANYLNEKVNKLSATHKRVSLLIFGLLMVAICTAMIIRSINDAGASVSIERITLPKDIYPNDEYLKGFKKILRIKSLLDSLRKSPGGIAVHDSLINASPGLIDSIGILIKKYNSEYSH